MVALESTIISHGLPRPRNLELAVSMEEVVREQGAVPATCGVIDGEVCVGLTSEEIEKLAFEDNLAKLSVRDLRLAQVLGRSGATTVSGTVALAAQAGIDVMATGGIGGVHKGAERTWDVSADLYALRSFPVAVVSAGVKSVLDIAATLELLETFGVPVVGWKTKKFPAFYVSDSGFELDWSVASVREAALLVDSLQALPGASGMVIANPVGDDHQLDPALHDRVLNEALRRAAEQGVKGKAVTPVLLAVLDEATGGRSVDVNVQLALANARLAASIAVEVVRLRG